MESRSNDKGMGWGCGVVRESWTLCRLVGAFVDLGITYFLLCCSAIAFVASKFLGIFGLALPCTCFGGAPCFQRLLVDCPPQGIASLQLAIKPNAPFHHQHQPSFSDPPTPSSRTRRRRRATIHRRSPQPLHIHPLNFSADDMNVGLHHEEDDSLVRILELALEEEQAARAELFSELEQERLAAASAADEAMAMISRLQEEKASIEIEARQYQRILEEKSLYDSEEMDILKEIIVRRERENHFFQKELEAYRKLFQPNTGWETHSNDAQPQPHLSVPLPAPSVDPMLYLQQLSESIDNPENINYYIDSSSAYAQNQTSNVSEGKVLPILPQDHETKTESELKSPKYSSILPDHLQGDDDGANHDIQEKGIVSIDEAPYPLLCEPTKSQGKNYNVYLQQKTIHGADDRKQMPLQAGEPCVHDVHTIDSNHSICKTIDGKEVDSLFLHKTASNIVRKPALEINRSSSDIFDRFPSASSSPDRSFVSESRRTSVSALDHERLKIDDEIGWLRARLRSVQEEKEKLKGSFEHQERAKTELQLLENIAAQLREIRQLTAPEKAARQASLPPLSSKVTSKKRRSRGVAIGAGQSESS